MTQFLAGSVGLVVVPDNIIYYSRGERLIMSILVVGFVWALFFWLKYEYKKSHTQIKSTVNDSRH